MKEEEEKEEDNFLLGDKEQTGHKKHEKRGKRRMKREERTQTQDECVNDLNDK